jgi:hypothetical protein
MSGTTRIPKAEITGLYGYLLKRFSRLGSEAGVDVLAHDRACVSTPVAKPNTSATAGSCSRSCGGCSPRRPEGSWPAQLGLRGQIRPAPAYWFQ